METIVINNVTITGPIGVARNTLESLFSSNPLKISSYSGVISGGIETVTLSGELTVTDSYYHS